MKILILTGRFGMGHYSAAEAVKQEILSREPEAKIVVVDIIEYMLPVFNKVVYSGFNFMVSKCSIIYNFLNGIAAKYGDVPFKKVCVKKVERLLKDHNPDLIIATLPVCSQYISAYKNTKTCNIPLYTYITDITAHEEWISDYTDMYFVGSETTKNMLITKGVSINRIIVSGIPVKEHFKNSDYLRKDRSKKEVLIMGGGLGLIPSADDLLKILSEQDTIHTTLITGKNQKLFWKIKRDFPQIEVIGYTDKVYEYMRNADLVITKSGGITTFEAIYSETPLYIIKPFLLQEVGNAKYIENLIIGKVMWTKNTDIAKDILSLLENEQLLNTMKSNMKKIRENMDNSSPLTIYYQKGAKLCG